MAKKSSKSNAGKKSLDATKVKEKPAKSVKSAKPIVSKKEKRETLKKPTLEKRIKNNIPALVIGGIFIVIVALVVFQNSSTEIVLGNNSTDAIEMVYFHLPTCPHCIKQNEFNKKLIEAYPDLKIVKYNLELQSSKDILKEYINKTPGLENEMIGTPLTIIGDTYTIGFGKEETSGLKISRMIEDAIAQKEEGKIE